MSLEDLAAAHARLNDQIGGLYAARGKLILAARVEGHTWQEIADTLDMTVHGAIKASKRVPGN